MASMGLVSKERKEPVVIRFDEETLKDCCNHIDASVSGVKELRKMSNSGTHCSISVRFSFSLAKKRKFVNFY